MKYTVIGIWERSLLDGRVSHYLQVEQKLNSNGEVEKVWINPFSIPEDLDTSKSKVGDVVDITCEKFNDKNQHAMACRCTICSGHMEKIMKMAEEQGTHIIDTGGKTSSDIGKELNQLKEKLDKMAAKNGEL